MADITWPQAQRILAGAVTKAEDIGTLMNIAVVDAGGNLKAFCRMDGAWLGSIDIAIKKARTARYFDMNTGDIGQLSQPGGPQDRAGRLQDRRRNGERPRQRRARLRVGRSGTGAQHGEEG